MAVLRLGVLSLLLLPTLALAKGKAKASASWREGFTADGTALVYFDALPIEGETDDGAQGAPPILCTLDVGVIVSTADFSERRFLADATGKDCSEAKKPTLEGTKALRPRAELDAFLAAHPLAPLAGPKGPAGAKVVGGHANCGRLKWTKQTASVDFVRKGDCNPPSSDGPDGASGDIDVLFRLKSGRAFLATNLSSSFDEMGALNESKLTPFWSKDGKAAGAVVARTGNVMRNGALIESTTRRALIVRFDDVRVSVVQHESSSARDALIAKLRQKPGLHVTPGSAQSKRAEAVLYAAAGYEQKAAELAKEIPGARVEPLAWKADADVVIALADAK